MGQKKLIVQKYGGATLADPQKIKQAAQRIFQLHQSGTQVVVVVSAMGQTTNQLIDLAHQVSERPQLRELDMLLTVGERISMSLLSMALNDLGCAAISFTGSQAGIFTDDSHINANIIDVKAFRVEEALKENKVVILAGFQGVSPKTKEITTLGRGGSDTSAVAMAGYLKADRCEILKDVDCVYTADPKIVSQAKPIPQLNYDHLLEMTSWGAKVLHYRSVEMALQKNVTLFVGPAADSSSNGTTITSDFKFNQSAAIAVNSHSIIFQISTEDIQKFLNLLSKNQIAEPRIVYQKNTDFFIAGPEEVLNSISQFESKQQAFKIINKNISSISVTYSQSVNEKNKKEASELLSKNKISVIELFETKSSLHFLLKKEDRTAAISYLHKLISN